MKWLVRFQARERGAIGEFTWTEWQSEADSQAEAIREIFEYLQAHNFETCGVTVRRMEEELQS